MNCDSPMKRPECLWDYECGNVNHKSCIEGKCVSRPSCTVTIYSGTSNTGSSKTLGPIYYLDRPSGERINLDGWWEDNIRSAKVSGGCAEVVIMDEDKCWEDYSDNLVVSNLDTNGEKRVNSFPYDVDQDACAIKVKVKKDWIP